MAETVKRLVVLTDYVTKTPKRLPKGYVNVFAESFVLKGTELKNFAFDKIKTGSVTVQGRHPDGTKYTYTSPSGTYVENVDYVIDYMNGTIARLPGSSIPDWTNKPAPTQASYGAETKNDNYLIWVIYQYEGCREIATFNEALPRLTNKIKTGTALSITVLGDSISTGLEAETTTLHAYYNVFAKRIKKFHKNITSITINNQAIGGTTSADLTDVNLQARVTGNPDLVIIAYGMNDQTSISGDTFEANIRNAISWIQINKPDTDIILISGCTANYDTFYVVADMERFEEYRNRYISIAAEIENVAFADVTTKWKKYLQRKTYHDLLRNDINHPTSFGHSVIYTEVLDEFIP